MTTNAIYRCEELEDIISVYDDIQENHYDDLNENNVYLEVLGDETAEEHDTQCKPQLPSPRPVTKCQDPIRDSEYEALKEKKSDHTYLHLLNEETEGCDQDTKAEDQDQGTKPPEQD